MFGSDLYIALILGVLLSLIFAEKTGIVPAGLVVPGYLGLVFNQCGLYFTCFASELAHLCYCEIRFIQIYDFVRTQKIRCHADNRDRPKNRVWFSIPDCTIWNRRISRNRHHRARFNCQYHSETRFNHYVRKHAAIERSDLCYHVCLLLNLM